MRLVIIYFGPLDVNSAIQAFHFGNELTDLGWEVTLAGRDDPGRMHAVGRAGFHAISHHELPSVRERMRRDLKETVVLAWTPREPVRMQTEPFARRGIPYVVHLEDNEHYLFARASGHTVEELARLDPRTQDRLSPPDLIHPSRHLAMMRAAAGVTMITEELNEFNVGGLPHHVARPGIDPERFRPDLEPPLSRGQLGIEPEEFVLVYHGTVHYANQHEMLSLYLAVALLRREGRPVRLVRLGETAPGGVDPRAFGALEHDVIELGTVPWREIPGYLALADGYVQPGGPDEFNRYRLPSKLPEFLAMGRPVVLPSCNLGSDLTDGQNALLLERGNALEIAARVRQLLDSPELAARLGAGARTFALEELNWRRNAAALGDFLIRVASGGGPARVPVGRAADEPAAAGAR